jgi:hypothetical protein
MSTPETSAEPPEVDTAAAPTPKVETPVAPAATDAKAPWWKRVLGRS